MEVDKDSSDVAFQQVRGPATAASYPVPRLLGAEGRSSGNTSELLLRAWYVTRRGLGHCWVETNPSGSSGPVS